MQAAPIPQSRDEALAWLRWRVHPTVQKIFDAEVPGKSFADLGCMWNCHGAYIFYAEQAGASAPLLAVDLGPTTPSFDALHRALDSRVSFRQKDIIEIDAAADGRREVVFCSGVLYHAPDPMRLLAAVTSITEETLILTTHTVEGTEPTLRFYPFDARPETYPWEVLAGGRDVRFGVAYPDGAPWWFGPTEICVDHMLRTVGFRVVDVQREILGQVPNDPLNPQISFFTARRSTPLR
jgi:hypothetical protein